MLGNSTGDLERTAIAAVPPKAGGEGPLCFIVDDEPAIGRFIAIALKNRGVEAIQYTTLPGMLEGLAGVTPDLIFLDLTLGSSDAIEAIRALAVQHFAGSIQLMSGRDTYLLEEVRTVGEHHGLRMLPVLQKPFRVDAIYRVLENEHLSPYAKNIAGVGPSTAASVPAEEQFPRVNLGEALRKKWLEFWYQPKLDLRRRLLIGAEGLARVRHPEHGILHPASFIPQAAPEDLLALSEHALNVALRDARDFAEAGHEVQLAINMPVDALLRLPIPAIVREHHGSNDRWSGIVLEVTEDQVMRDIAAAHEIATQLRIYHISLAIDDFGRGYSSLSRLKDLPFGELKVDRSFVADSGSDPTNAALCRTVVELAHRFGSLAVAEGVENATDLLAVARAGCDLAQGFLFAHAMPKEFLLARLMADGSDGGFGKAIASIANVWQSAGRFRASA